MNTLYDIRHVMHTGGQVQQTDGVAGVVNRLKELGNITLLVEIGIFSVLLRHLLQRACIGNTLVATGDIAEPYFATPRMHSGMFFQTLQCLRLAQKENLHKWHSTEPEQHLSPRQVCHEQGMSWRSPVIPCARLLPGERAA